MVIEILHSILVYELILIFKLILFQSYGGLIMISYAKFHLISKNTSYISCNKNLARFE